MELGKLSLFKILGARMSYLSERQKVLSENIANADSLGKAPGEDPYQRKVSIFRNILDRDLGMDKVQISKIDIDRSDFPKRFEPGHPAANADGYVLTPNVNPLVEMMDMREAQRSYEANMNVISTSRQMVAKTLELLK